jgi:hypothetical protein
MEDPMKFAFLTLAIQLIAKVSGHQILGAILEMYWFSKSLEAAQPITGRHLKMEEHSHLSSSFQLKKLVKLGWSMLQTRCGFKYLMPFQSKPIRVYIQL